MSAFDYSAALAAMPTTSPSGITNLLRLAAEPMGGTDLTLYLVDFEQIVLEPALAELDGSGQVVSEEDVATTMAGRAFQTGQPVAVERDDGVRVWVAVTEQSDRTGVLALTLPRVDDQLLDACMQLGSFAGLLIQSAARATDVLHLRRRRRVLSLAAGMQWDLLPPLIMHCTRASACGVLEPAYEIAGDAFDYAINGDQFHAALFDGLGHGIQSTLMTFLAMGAYRHARRGGNDLPAMYAKLDEVLVEQYRGDAFVTGLLARLELQSGRLHWVNGGHPRPLLLRQNKVVSELACAPSLPFGLGGRCNEEACESLEPGDSVLFFTDGVTEGRPQGGAEFGVDRLADLLERESATADRPEEVLRRLRAAIVEYQSGKLRDDATLLLLHWSGAEDC